MTAALAVPSRPPLTAGLIESYEIGTRLRIDKAAGIIYGVKLGGLESPNTHGIPGVTKGTKYKPSAYKSALNLYEGVKVYERHAERGKPAERGPFESLGVIQSPRWDDASKSPRGDFHYVKSHPRASELVEDIERGLGRFGLSHHIPPGQFDATVEGGWLVVEAIRRIKSVDLVDDPATTRNLWEGREPMETTLKAILEKFVDGKSAARKAIATALIEDDAPAMTAPMPAPDGPDAGSEVGEPEDELWAGFQSAIIAIINGDGSAADKAKQVAKYLKAHEKLTAAPEPKAEGDSPDDVGGKTAAESKEAAEVRAENSCLRAGITNPKPSLIKALAAMTDEAERRDLIEQVKAAQAANPTPATRRPTSYGPARRTATSGRVLTESKIPTGDAFRRSIKE